MNKTMLKPLFRIEETTLVEGRGRVIAPALKLDEIEEKTKARFRAILPDGQMLELDGQVVTEHVRLTKGATRWDRVVLLQEDSPELPVGTELLLFSKE